MSETNKMIDLEVRQAASVAEGIHMFELARPDGGALPRFAPGAHVHVRVPNGETRQYSLCNDPAETDRYVIAVKREAEGRGGSIGLIDGTKAGDTLAISEPVNEFGLVERSQGFVFIAGGIGITPILSMARHLARTASAPFKLYYLTRSPEMTAFADVLERPEFDGRIVLHHDYGRPENALDLKAVLAEASGKDVYCCGPRALLEKVRELAEDTAIASLHFEDFGGIKATQADGDKPFTVRLAKSGVTVEVPTGTTILEALRAAGYDVPSSCEAGTCGTCRTGLLGGIADHRDLVLFDDEMDDNIMICCSRAKTDELVLDL